MSRYVSPVNDNFNRFNVQPSWILSQSKKCRVAENKPLNLMCVHFNQLLIIFSFTQFSFTLSLNQNLIAIQKTINRLNGCRKKINGKFLFVQPDTNIVRLIKNFQFHSTDKRNHICFIYIFFFSSRCMEYMCSVYICVRDFTMSV